MCSNECSGFQLNKNVVVVVSYLARVSYLCVCQILSGCVNASDCQRFQISLFDPHCEAVGVSP